MCSINIGVPQESVLGTVLFLLYINNQLSCIAPHLMSLYADGTSMLVSSPNLFLSVSISTLHRLNHKKIHLFFYKYMLYYAW